MKGWLVGVSQIYKEKRIYMHEVHIPTYVYVNLHEKDERKRGNGKNITKAVYWK